MYDSLFDTLKGQSSTEINTSPGICTTHHLIETLFSYIPVKNIFLTNSLETRTDPDQLVSEASWSGSVPFL